jgi:predicted ATPase
MCQHGDVILEFDHFQLDDQRLTLSGPEGPVHLEPQVLRLLLHLIVNRDRVVAKEELLDEVWGDRFVSESALTSRVKSARQAVGDDGSAQRIIKTVHGRGYHFVAPVRTEVDTRRRSLPRLRSELIDRADDIDGVIERVRAAALVTVTGPGGMGKTTVALAAAEILQPEFDDGAIFIDLTPVAPGADLTRAVADAAGLEGDAAASLDGVAAHLAQRPVLLVLDNCEHVLDRAAELVDRLLVRDGRARILATSREPIGVGGEHVWPLNPLRAGGPELFVARARAAEPRVEWEVSDPAIVELCDRLDNVPLALEIAAGQLRRFGLDQLMGHLDDHLMLPAKRAGADGHRHASIEATIDWSYQLLEPSEQCLLRHLSVFPSTFDLDAACAAAGPLLAPMDAAASVGELVDKSLVVRLHESGRYRLLEMIRVFARQRLEESGELAGAIEAHRVHVRDRVGSTSRLERWLSARLASAYRTDLENVRLAFHGSLDRGHVEDAVEIAVGGSFLWRQALGVLEGDSWVAMLLERDLLPDDRRWVEILRADVGQGRGDHRQLFDAALAALALDEVADDRVAACLASHFASLVQVTDPDAARSSLTEALERAAAAGDARLVTLMESFLVVADIADGDLERAGLVLERLGRSVSEDGYDAFIVNWTGWMLALAERDAEQAWRWMTRQHDYLHRTGVVETWITSFSTALCEAVAGGDVAAMLIRSLRLADREGYDASGDCVLALAYAEVCADRFDAAAELVGTALHSRFNATAHYVLYRAVIDSCLRQHLDDDAVRQAMKRGRDRGAAQALAARGIQR